MKKLLLIFYFFHLFSITLPSQNIYAFAGTGTVAGNIGDGGLAVNCKLLFPKDVCADQIGNIYIADWSDHRIRKVNSSGIITTVAGIGNNASSGDGGLATSAEVSQPSGLFCDVSGNIFIAEAFKIRKINPSGIITTFAGNGLNGYDGDGGLAINAKLGSPNDICFDQAGNAYIATNNNCIRKVNTSGIITTYAGTGASGYTGDGGAAINATFVNPKGLTIDSQGNLYVSDTGNDCIRRIDATTGIITTVIGDGNPAFNGDGGQATNAQVCGPWGIEFDPSGNLYISDYCNHRIRRVSTSGIISTIVGNGVQGNTGDSGPAISASLGFPYGLTLDPTGNIYVVDAYNLRVREICFGNCFAGIGEKKINENIITLYPNPNNGEFKFTTNISEGKAVIVDALGRAIHEKRIITGINDFNARLNPGVYSCILYGTEQQVITTKFIVN